MRTQNFTFTIIGREPVNLNDYPLKNMFIQSQGPPTVLWNDFGLVISNIIFYYNM